MVEQSGSRNQEPSRETGLSDGQDRREADRRGAERYPLAAPVRWANGAGVARNISATGLLFETDMPLTPGSLMKLAVIGEATEGDSKRVYALCDVVVVRAARSVSNGGKCEIAVAFDSVRLH